MGNDGNGSGESAKPDLTETLIILLFSAAITVFVLWVANQEIDRSVFATLPDWVVGASKGIWTSMTTGVAGVGLAIAKAFGKSKKQQPNYLLYVGITTACLFLPITAIAAMNYKMNGIYRATLVDPHLYRIDPKSTKELEFELTNSPASTMIRYKFRGTYRVEGNLVKLHLASGEITMAPYLPGPGPTQLSELSFWGNYLKKAGDHDETAQTSLVLMPSASVDLNMPVKINEHLELKPADLSFELPQGVDLSRMWLSGGIRTDAGGYIPFQWG